MHLRLLDLRYTKNDPDDPAGMRLWTHAKVIQQIEHLGALFAFRHACNVDFVRVEKFLALQSYAMEALQITSYNSGPQDDIR